MRDVVICEPLRTPIGRYGGSLRDCSAVGLGETVLRELLGFGAADFGRLNVHGSGISLGHPVGATGTRILATLTREMARRQARYGLVTMCIGGRQGLAAIFERIAA